MASLNPYLHFNGNAEEAFEFYKSVFGGEYATVMRNKDIPSDTPNPTQPEEANQILHIALPIGNGSLLMASDIPQAFGSATIGNNFYVSVNAESREEADKLFNGLSEGGKVMMPMDNTFWGAYFGMLTDKFQVQWMINFDQRTL